MLVLVYHIGFTTDILLCGQLVGELKTSNTLGYGYLRSYTSLLVCAIDASHVNSASLVCCTETEH